MRTHHRFLILFLARKQKRWVDANGRVTACSGFCNRVFHACAFARWRGKRLVDLFANGKEFCEAQNFAVAFLEEKSSASGLRSGNALLLAMTLGATLGAWLVSGERADLRGVGLGNSIPVLLLLLLFGTICGAAAPDDASTGACPYYNYRAPSPQWGLKNCTWFKPWSCCHPREEAMLLSAIDDTSELIFHTTPQCQQLINFLGCWPCHPGQTRFFDSLQQRLTVCASFCTSMHSARRNAMWGAGRVDELFEDGLAFCAALRLDVQHEEMSEISEAAVSESQGADVVNEKSELSGGGGVAYAKGCLDVTDDMFIGDSWCHMPVDRRKSAASRAAAWPGCTLQLFCLALLTLMITGEGGAGAGTGAGAGAGAGAGGRARGRARTYRPAWMLCASVGLICFAVAVQGSPIATTTVEAWAAAMGHELSSIASSKLRAPDAQRIFDNANYTVTSMDGATRVAMLAGYSDLIPKYGV